VRAARQELTRSSVVDGKQVTRDAGGWAGMGSLPFAWSQLVLYQRGSDHPLGRPVTRRFAETGTETTERQVEAPILGGRTRVLRKGFVGRRRDMHALRRDLRRGRHVHVVQGLGGLGKSAFCAEALKLYKRQGWMPVELWCADAEGSADPAGALVQQFTRLGPALVGEQWEEISAAVDQAARDNPAFQRSAVRLVALLSLVLQVTKSPLVVYLENLETLMRGPDNSDPAALGEWREGADELWNELLALADERRDRLALLASCRYRHAAFQGRLFEFHRLPDDALWRLMGWFSGLRRLSVASRARLVGRLTGHPRSLEFLDKLVQQAIYSWEAEHGDLEEARLDPEHEWREIVEPALPPLDRRLSEDLLFGALWKRVLDEPGRALLVRAGVLRRPAEAGLVAALYGDDDTAEAVIGQLVDASLLSEVWEGEPGSRRERRYEVHPTLVRLALEHSADAEVLRWEGHQRAGEFLERAVYRTDALVHLEAAYHLGEVGEFDRAFDLLGPLVQWLLRQGRLLDSTMLLNQIRGGEALEAHRQNIWYMLRGDIQVGFGDLSGALAEYRRSHEIFEALAGREPGNMARQRDLSVSHDNIGGILQAQGDLSGALAAYQHSLEIRQPLAGREPGNTQWQRDLSISQENLSRLLETQRKVARPGNPIKWLLNRIGRWRTPL
jgi:tetratricopeptide (TPR) repeat protein